MVGIMKYALLSYGTQNLGDPIQSLAAKQFLPRVDFFVDRDRMPDSADRGDAFLFANGWFSHAPQNFPPPSNLHPFWISLHLAQPEMLSERFLDHLRERAPIGCRDTVTLGRLQSYGITSYFSACLTLTLRPPAGTARGDRVYLVDVQPLMHAVIPRRIRDQAQIVHHDWDDEPPSTSTGRRSLNPRSLAATCSAR